MVKKVLSVLVLAVIMLTMLTGCGGDRLSGTYVTRRADNLNSALNTFGGSLDYSYEFFGKNYIKTKVREDGDDVKYIEEKGKYSISGDMIEFVPDDGKIYAISFSHTENTFIIIPHNPQAPNEQFIKAK